MRGLSLFFWKERDIPGYRFESCRSRVPTISSFTHASATTPTEPLDAVALSSNGDGLPQKPDGSASATLLFEACSAFTHVPACMLAKSPKVTRYIRVLHHICYLLRRSDGFRPSDRLAGRDLHPLEIADFHGILD